MSTWNDGADGPPGDQWVPDELLAGYDYLSLHLADPVLAAGEPADTQVSAGLMRRNPPRRRRAVLYLHGWSDYFFQTWLADYFDEQGFDFYALELRRYGRDLREGQLGGYTTDLTEYYEEIDLAFDLLGRDHDTITLMGHSTGGLVASLWAHERPGRAHGLILNSPWLDFQGSPVLRSAAAMLAKSVVKDVNRAARTIPLPDSNTYLRSIHSSMDGEWDFDLSIKRNPAFTIRPGWLTAIAVGHERVRAGLEIDTPVLAMLSRRSDFKRTWHDGQMTADTVLDVHKLARRCHQLGPNVTIVRINDGLHDLVLSRSDVRAEVFDSMTRWMRAWLPEKVLDVEA
ncbi:alpha/beta hydrolase [Propionibacteriaceae bacterium Y1923]|uniref:alpha/beta hydrolase n=1 Tax=Aestuariimicrobium sp. Y1814 TaxID=3418742 RepID=UPI003C223A0E